MWDFEGWDVSKSLSLFFSLSSCHSFGLLPSLLGVLAAGGSIGCQSPPPHP